MEKISTLVEGGKATAGPPLGPKLGPLGINIGDVVNKINEKTKDMAGIKVPVTLSIDPKTKEYEIEVGTPSVSSLIKKELNLKSGAGNQKMHVADMSVDRAIKIAKVKLDGLLSYNIKSAVKEVLGACVSMGILVEGKDAREIQKEIDNGKYAKKISGEQDLVFWDNAKLEQRKSELQEVIKEAKKKAEEEEAARAAEEEAEAAEEKEEVEEEEKPVEEAPKAEEKPAEEKPEEGK
ncbi:MAG: 50S ribosomal protein L11 [Candidatus Woesearchaeota archaeon]|nr:MAG: 50S ribosomal protein L11 [Candidatus Woesearchaeota archaeon]